MEKGPSRDTSRVYHALPCRKLASKAGVKLPTASPGHLPSCVCKCEGGGLYRRSHASASIVGQINITCSPHQLSSRTDTVSCLGSAIPLKFTSLPLHTIPETHTAALDVAISSYRVASPRRVDAPRGAHLDGAGARDRAGHVLNLPGHTNVMLLDQGAMEHFRSGVHASEWPGGRKSGAAPSSRRRAESRARWTDANAKQRARRHRRSMRGT